MSLPRSLIAGAAIVLGAAPAAAQYQTINLGGLTNSTFFNAGVTNGGYFPFGAQILGGVPFVIDQTIGEAAQARGWFSSVAASSGIASVVVPINVFGVDRVYTLMNTMWGQPGAASFASLTFTGSAGDVFVMQLIGGIDIRDYAQGSFTNTINGTTTIQVFDIASMIPVTGQRLDRQMIDLPGVFLNQTLMSVTVTDFGGTNFSRAFLAGVTTQQFSTVPEPSTVFLLAGGMALIGLVARKRCKRAG
jgi:hypothetical protein